MNRGTNKIKISKKKKLRDGDERAINLVARHKHIFNNGTMISGGIFNKGLGKIIFHNGNVNTFSCKQVLEFYREDFNQYPIKFFQQDGARSHSSKLSRKNIISLFGERFIPTWDKGP